MGLGDCGAPKYFNTHRPSLWSTVSGVPPGPKHRHTGFQSQHCTGGVHEGEQEKISLLADGGSSYSSCQGWLMWSLITTQSSCFYELSRASRTFMICCLMTLVASPALGIRYLRKYIVTGKLLAQRKLWWRWQLNYGLQKTTNRKYSVWSMCRFCKEPSLYPYTYILRWLMLV